MLTSLPRRIKDPFSCKFGKLFKHLFWHLFSTPVSDCCEYHYIMHTKLQEIYLFYRQARYIWFFSEKIMGLLRLTFRNIAPLIEWGPFRFKPVELFTFLCLRYWPLILFKKLVRTGDGATTHSVFMNLIWMVWRKIWQTDLFLILCFSGFSSKIYLNIS